MDIQSFKKIHCIGIGGIGISALAKFFALQGASVTGSDLVTNELIDELRALGVKVSIGHTPGNVPTDAELVVHSPAITSNNSEYLIAKEFGLEVKSYPEVLGELSKSRRTIAVTGMHGKSTTTAMIGSVLASLDPLVIVGSRVKGFSNGNLQYTQSSTSPFVVEACEYRGHMRHLSPSEIVITNIEEEHMDYYRDLAHIKETFQEFTNTLTSEGVLYVNADDENALQLHTTGTHVPFGIGKGLVAGFPEDFIDGIRRVRVEQDGQVLGIFQLSIPGLHNVRNALAAVACGVRNGIEFSDIADALKNFHGIWRRFEKVGMYKTSPVYSDYGHHPTEIIATLQGARELYPHRRLVLLFQPHQYDRTKKLFNDFLPALCIADFSIIADVYDVAGREEDRSVNSEMLATACNSENVVYGGDLDQSRDRLLSEVKERDVIIIMGAGEVDRIARELVSSSLRGTK